MIYDEFISGDYSSFKFFAETVEKKKFSKIDKCYCEYMSILKESFQKRFADFERIKHVMKFGRDILECDFEILKQCCETFNVDYNIAKHELNKMKSMLELGGGVESQLLQFKSLKKLMACSLAIFPSSYLCESTSSVMNFVLNQYRSNLTQEHLIDAVLVAITKIEVNIKKLCLKMICQIWHYLRFLLI